ncbi:MAG TPA: zinc-binding dehydrogenase, partial [Terriglobales bacterium]|nr:zinc-binding dehydrogenase [Terriglobales bacterium]
RFEVIGNSLDGGFAEYLRVPSYALFRLPDAVDFEVGSLTEPLAVAVHALRLQPLTLGDRVLVLGAGTIGLMSVAAAKAAGAGEIWVRARHPHQAEAALRLGTTRVFLGAQADAELSSAAHADAVDLVVETVGGHADTINDGLHLVRRGGTIVVLGVFSASPQINAIALVVKEVRLIGSMTYGRQGTRADFDRALAMLAADPERFRSLITHRLPLTDIQTGFEAAADKHSGSLKVTIVAAP